MTFLMFYVTNKNKKEAKKLVNHLISKKLIACANFFPIESQYVWKGKIAKSKEVVSLLKTSKNKAKLTEAEIKKIHPYKIPCIIRLKVKANSDYETWINKEILE
jgi:periplasmic divalent cation tolerance protein